MVENFPEFGGGFVALMCGQIGFAAQKQPFHIERMFSDVCDFS
jgi:hypothetical protein